jgi:hypothetical protein
MVVLVVGWPSQACSGGSNPLEPDATGPLIETPVLWRRFIVATVVRRPAASGTGWLGRHGER